MGNPNLSRGRPKPYENVAIGAGDAARYVADEIPSTGVYERRVQALLFIATVNWNDAHTHPFSNASFRKQGAAVFAPEIRDEVETWLSRPSFPFSDGRRVPKYTTRNVSLDVANAQGEHPKEAVALLDAVINEFHELDRMELMTWCVNQPETDGLTSGQAIEF